MWLEIELADDVRGGCHDRYHAARGSRAQVGPEGWLAIQPIVQCRDTGAATELFAHPRRGPGSTGQ